MSGRFAFRRRTAGAFLALVALGITTTAVRADAPSGQYATFGRGDRCISDVYTKLTWLREPTGPTALGAVACPSGWRLPSVNELETLVDESPHYELEDGTALPHAIDANAFPGTPVASPYWTSSVQGGQNWAVYFEDGSTLLEPSSIPLWARCVVVTPSGGSGSLPACQ